MMVIMERLKARDANDHFRFTLLPASVLDDLKSAIDVLHEAGLVFGDLRRPNVLIKETGQGEVQALLVDFEWVGLDNQARNPPSLNDTGMIA
jgi:RIO-like serine/threonine protein kinase